MVRTTKKRPGSRFTPLPPVHPKPPRAPAQPAAPTGGDDVIGAGGAMAAGASAAAAGTPELAPAEPRAAGARGGLSRIGLWDRLWPWLRSRSRLQAALAFSITLHAGLIGFKFAAPEAFDRMFMDTPLEVILVNARGNEVPKQAQAVAQASLAGGGNLDKGRATSPLVASARDADGDANDDARRRVEHLQQEQQQLLAQVRRDLALLPPPDPSRDSGRPQDSEQEERRRQLLKLLAEIEKRIQEENARPRKRYISPATREAVYALYYDALRRRIEDRGTRDFPEHQGRKLYGELMMNLTIDARGQLVEADLVQSSGNRILDRRAVAIVRAAGPFGNFSPEMRQRSDLIVVTSRFRFTREESLEATMTDSQGR